MKSPIFFAYVDAPESIAISSYSTSTTLSTSSTSTPSSSGQSVAHKSGGGGTNAGAIVGGKSKIGNYPGIYISSVSQIGVIGGVALLTIIVGVTFFLVVRSRKRPYYQGPPISDYTTYPSNRGRPVTVN